MIVLNNEALTKLAGGMVVGSQTLEIYSGTMPTTYVSAATYASQLLGKTASGAFTLASASPGIVRMSTSIPSFNATASGTATWFALLYSSSVIFGEITDLGPNIAPMYMANVNTVTGQPISIAQIAIKFLNAA